MLLQTGKPTSKLTNMQTQIRLNKQVHTYHVHTYISRTCTLSSLMNVCVYMCVSVCVCACVCVAILALAFPCFYVTYKPYVECAYHLCTFKYVTHISRTGSQTCTMFDVHPLPSLKAIVSVHANKSTSSYHVYLENKAIF